MDRYSKAVITESMIINGDIKSNDPVEICGRINGNVEAPDLDVTGDIVGNVNAEHNINLNSARITGNVTAGDNLDFSAQSVVVGDINASTGKVAGAVKGTVTINADVCVEDTAIVYGDVYCQKVQLNSGAVVEGRIHQEKMSGMNLDEVFEKRMAR